VVAGLIARVALTIALALGLVAPPAAEAQPCSGSFRRPIPSSPRWYAHGRADPVTAALALLSRGVI
jgi:hypothetical protein